MKKIVFENKSFVFVIGLVLALSIAFELTSIESFALPRDYEALVTQFMTGEDINLPAGKTNIYFKNDTDETVYINIISKSGLPVRDLAITYERDPNAFNNIMLSPGGSNSNLVISGSNFRMIKNVKNDISPAPDPAPAPAPAHTHEFIEGTITEPTADSDGVGGIYCKTCGYIKRKHIRFQHIHMRFMSMRRL